MGLPLPGAGSKPRPQEFIDIFMSKQKLISTIFLLLQSSIKTVRLVTVGEMNMRGCTASTYPHCYRCSGIFDKISCAMQTKGSSQTRYNRFLRSLLIWLWSGHRGQVWLLDVWAVYQARYHYLPEW